MWVGVGHCCGFGVGAMSRLPRMLWDKTCGVVVLLEVLLEVLSLTDPWAPRVRLVRADQTCRVTHTYLTLRPHSDAVDEGWH